MGMQMSKDLSFIGNHADVFRSTTHEAREGPSNESADTTFQRAAAIADIWTTLARAHGVERQPARTADIERQQAAGDRGVLEEVEHLRVIVEVGVKEKCRDHAEAGQRQAGEPRPPAGDQQDGAGQLDEDGDRQQAADHAVPRQEDRRLVVALNLADAGP